MEAGIKSVDTVAEVSSGVEYIITVLPNTAHVEETLKKEGGIFESADKGTMICDTSTISPMASKEFHADSLKHGLTFIDTPMSGGIAGATN